MALFYRSPKFTKPPLDIPFEVNRASPQARGLVAWWPPIASRGTNVLRDLGGRGLNGVFKGPSEPAWIGDAQFGMALSFDGSDDYIATTINNLPLTELTIGFWAISTCTIVGSSGRPFGYENSSSGAHGLAMYFPTLTNPTLIMRDNGATYDASFGSIVIGSWYHYVVAISSLVGTALYLSGTQTNLNANAKSYSSADVSFKIGAAGTGASIEAFKGFIGELRIYNNALSPAAIWQMWDPASRWDLYAPIVRWWALGTPAGAVRILPQIAMLGGQSVPSISPHVGGLL